MSTPFNEADHPREAGRFTTKDNSPVDPAVLSGLISEPREHRVGEFGPIPLHGDRVIYGDVYGRVIHAQDDHTFIVLTADGTQHIASAREVELSEETGEQLLEHALVEAAIANIDLRVGTLTPSELTAFSEMYDEVGDSQATDIREAARRALSDMPFDEVDHWLDDAAGALYGNHDRELVERHCDDDVALTMGYRALSAASDAALALAHRQSIGKVPGWTQTAYDHQTRPWRTIIGPIHPDDEIRPDSWAKRPSVHDNYDAHDALLKAITRP